MLLSADATPARYLDAHGELCGTLHNDGKWLTLKLGEVSFSGLSFDSLSPDAPLPDDSRFQLQHDVLCQCTLYCVLPLALRSTEGLHAAQLEIVQHLGKPASNGGLDRADLQLYLHWQSQGWSSRPQRSDFEDALLDLQRQLPEGLHLHCCFGCQYGDYSVYGQGSFGSLMCFRDHKATYDQVRSKLDYRQQLDQFSATVQETGLCAEFTPRKPGAGYRG